MDPTTDYHKPNHLYSHFLKCTQSTITLLQKFIQLLTHPPQFSFILIWQQLTILLSPQCIGNKKLIMLALWNRADHYIFAMVYSFFFFLA